MVPAGTVYCDLVDSTRIFAPFRATGCRSCGCAPPPVTRPAVAGLIASGRTRGGRAQHRVPRSDPDLSRLRGGIHVLGRRAGLLCREGSPERPPAVPNLPPDGPQCSRVWSTSRVPRGHLRDVRGPGRCAVRATQRPTGVLQLLLRQGSRRSRHVGLTDAAAGRIGNSRYCEAGFRAGLHDSAPRRDDPGPDTVAATRVRRTSARHGVRGWECSSFGRWWERPRGRGATPLVRRSRRPPGPFGTYGWSRS